MNKQLIKKYFEEFKHWLNGGKLLQKQINLAIPAEWEEFEEDWDWPIDELVVVINDEFCEFRKALAEGKTVQYNFGNYGINRKDFPNTWKDLDPSIGILADRACPENYRIRPEEPKFKVGDWLIEIHSSSYAKVLEVIKKDLLRVNLYDSNAIITTESTDFILWQPKKGEWCWFWNFNEMPTLEQFSKYHDLDDHLGNYETLAVKLYQHCEPFLGQLPTNLQETL